MTIVALAGLALGTLVLGLLLWREAAAKARLAAKYAQLSYQRDVYFADANALRAALSRANGRCSDLEKQLAEIDPARLFDSVFSRHPPSEKP